MRLLRVASMLMPALLTALPSAAAVAQDAVPERGVYAFTNVNVLPMTEERVDRDRTVVVRDGRIVAVGPAADVTVPGDAVRIDGRGRYLIPGLAEMHGHIPGGSNSAFAEDVLFLYVAAGATTVRGMQGAPTQIELRRRVQAGELIGPRMWLAAPQMGSGIDAATAAQRVRDAKAAGFDLMKTQEGLSREAYDAMVATARERDMPWGGHVSAAVGLDHVLTTRMSTVDHIDDYLDALQRPNSPALSATGSERVRLLPLHADPSLIPQIARRTADAGVAIVPTMMLWEVLRGARDPDALMTHRENRYMPQMSVQGWHSTVSNLRSQADVTAAAREAELRKMLLRGLHDAGVTILMGTDAPQLFSVPGFSLHRELPIMVEAGMTPYEVLRSGTVNVARFFGIGDEAGTIETGRRADLVLLGANPLEDIRAVESNEGVMVDGRWLSAEFIRQRLDAIAARHGG